MVFLRNVEAMVMVTAMATVKAMVMETRVIVITESVKV